MLKCKDLRNIHEHLHTTRQIFLKYLPYSREAQCEKMFVISLAKKNEMLAIRFEYFAIRPETKNIRQCTQYKSKYETT